MVIINPLSMTVKIAHYKKKKKKHIPGLHELGMEVNVCGIGALKAEAGEPEVKGLSHFVANLRPVKIWNPCSVGS